MDFHIVDLVQIPTDLPLGDYVLSFRWDCEQTPQIWTNCADIEITESGTNRARREGMLKRSVDRKKALRGGLLGPF
jgi:predicted carbohydrate-binding protein with CBM5 and CBM33 domain